MSFHERQHAELSALGRSRIEAAKAFMDGIVKREALRHATSSLGADTSLYSGQTGMQAGQGLEKEQKGSGVSRTPPVRMAQVLRDTVCYTEYGRRHMRCESEGNFYSL